MTDLTVSTTQETSMSTPSSPAAAGEHVGGAREFFARADFEAQPAKACHAWVRRFPDRQAAERVAGRHTAALASGALPAGTRLWTEELPTEAGHPASVALREREISRPVGHTGPLVRAVLLSYADGAADLVLVAHRHNVDSLAIARVGSLLSDDGQEENGFRLNVPAQAVRRPAPDIVLPAWGLGDARRAGVVGRVPIGPVEVAPEPADPVLLAATALALSRYGEGAAHRVGLLAQDPEYGDFCTAVTLPVDQHGPIADVVAAADNAIASSRTTGVQDEPPAVGLLLPRSGRADEYRPFQAPPFPVTLVWEPRRDGTLAGTLWYDESALSPAVAAQFARHVRVLVELCGRKAPEAGATQIGGIELVDAEERSALLALGRPSALSEHAPSTIHEAFRRIADAQPDAPALSDSAQTLTYRGLDERADRFAAGLRNLGVLPGALVGVCLDREADLVVTLLAVLKCGAAYVPMDPRYPTDRLRYTAEDAGLRLVVTTLDEFPELDGVSVVRPGTLSDSAPAGQETAEPTDPDAAAYVIYTSGSTGRPKGVVVPHHNVGSLIAATAPDMGLGPADVWTLFHSSAFDFSVWEIWGSLLTGGHLIVVPYWVSRNPAEFHALLVERKVTVLSQTPSAFASLREVDLAQQTPLFLRLVVFGGEPLDVRALELWFRRHPHDRCRLVNMFGITETTVHVTTQTITPVEVAAGSRSVGTALPGWSLSVRDERGRVQPLGVPGEIYVGGAGLADRYLNRPELTAERFVHDPLTGERVYRSGDLGRLRPDGRLDHLGRIDDQVKVRGFRIELGEIRSVLLDDPAVIAAAVVLHQGAGDAADVRLDAYVVLRQGGSVTEVRRRAKGILPEYMLPATVTAVPEIPLTVNGKVDTARLPKPDQTPVPLPGPAEDEVGAPAEKPKDLAEVVLNAWRATLGPQVTPEDDFFELGGNSLMAIRLSAALRREGMQSVPLRDLYLYPTAASLTEHLKSTGAQV
ncbi:amino acid adenylation domain-containing protein [Streptomyces sp. NPDC086549]|uniref:amino acid adenylation domain-containing protein n=1 Tax=Streptomyces sp. NPDC086549 TaxID=3365752 RepID=UPI0037FAF4B6